VVVIAAALLPLLLVFYFAFDAPIWDDIDIHLDFLIRLGQAQTFSEQLGLWFHPNGEHFVLPNKAAAWLCQAFFGSVNYRALLIAGSLAVPISLALLLVPLRGSQRGALWGAAMMALIFCSPRYDQSLLWASGAWQHMWELPFALGFLVFVFSNQRRLQIVSLVCAVAATLTQGNGALVLFAAAVPFAFMRSGRRAVACGLIGLLLLIPLVINSLHSAASAPLPSLPELGVYVCTFLGSGIGFSATSAAILGTFLLALHLFLQLRTSSRDAPAYFAILAWCVLTAAANAIGRAGFGASYAWEQTRYQLPSLLYIAILAWLTVSLLVPIGQRKIALVVTTLGGAALFIFSLIGAVPAFQSRHDLAESAAIRWSYFKGYPEHPSKEHATKILLAADRLGVYRP